MANKFLNSGGESANLTNGTVDFYGASLGAISLAPSQTVKTNGSRQLISADLVIGDVVGLQTALNNTIKNPYVGYLTATGYKTSGATPGVAKYLLDDGTTAGAVVVGGQSNIYYYDFSQFVSLPPSNGQIRYNNLESTTSTAIYVSHLTSVNPTDVDPFLALITDLSILYIQDRNDSTNFVKFKVNGTPTNTPNSYWTIPVIYQSAEGTGLTRFPNGHPIYMSVFFDTEEENTRIGILEDKTFFQSKTDYTTSFLYPGTSGGMYSYISSPSTPALGALFPGWTSGFIGSSFTATTPFTLVEYRVPTGRLTNAGNTRIMNLFKNGLIIATFTFDKTVVSGSLSIFTFPANYDLTAGNYSLGLDLLTYDSVYTAPTFTSLIPNFINIASTIYSGTAVTDGIIMVNTRSDTTIQCDRFVAPNGGSAILRADGTYDTITDDKLVNQSRITTTTSFIGTETSGSVKMFSFTSGGSWAASGFAAVYFTATKNFNLVRYTVPTGYLLGSGNTRQLTINKNGSLFNTYTFNKTNVDGLGYSFYEWVGGLSLTVGDYQVGLDLTGSDYASYQPVYTSNYPFFTNIVRSNALYGFGDLNISYVFDYSLKADKFIAPNGGTALLKADGSYDANSYLPLTGGIMTGALEIANGVNEVNIPPPQASGNILIGGSVIPNITTVNNTILGVGAGASQTTGLLNTFIGYNAGYTNTISANSTAIGNNAQITASNQVRLGNTSITEVITSGTYKGAGFSITGANEVNIPQPLASNNIIIGGATIPSITTTNNTFLGASAGGSQSSGYSNTCIGYNAGYSNTAFFNSSAIGQNAQITASNQVRLGNTSVGEVITSGYYKGAGFAATGGTSNTFLVGDGSFVIQQLTQGYIIANYVGIQYIHGSGINSNISNVASSALGSTSSVNSTYALTNNFTRQLCAALWVTSALADGAACGYGVGVGNNTVAICSNFPFGLYFSLGIADTAYNANNCQNFWGLWNATTTITLTQANQLSTRRNMICFGSDTNDANICIYTAGLSTTVLQVDLGASFPANRPSGAASTDIFKLALWWDKTTVYYKAFNETQNVVIHGNFTPNASDMPQTSISIYPQCVRVMGTPQSNGQAKLQVQRFGVYH